MKKANKILSIFLVVIMVLSMMPFTVSAASSGTCGTDATWTYNSETGTLIILGTGAMDRYKSTQSPPWDGYKSAIKSIIIEEGITSIGNYAFKGCTNLTYLSIPDTVTEIGSSAFSGCTKLESIFISDNVTSIGTYAFENCTSLKSVTLSNNLYSISDYSFKGCSSLVYVDIPDGVYFIYASAFEGCSKLKSVFIGVNLLIVYGKAFKGCSSLTDIYYAGTEEQWNMISVVETGNTTFASATVYYNEVEDDDGSAEHKHSYTVEKVSATCTDDGSITTACSCGETTVEVLPALGHAEKKLPEKLPTTTTEGCTPGVSCSRCGEVLVAQQIIPALDENVTDMGIEGNLYWTFDAFAGVLELHGGGPMKDYEKITDTPWNSFATEVKTVIIHEGIQTVGSRSFTTCSSLRNLQIPSTVTRIGEHAFNNCSSLKNVRMAYGVEIIEQQAFGKCTQLESITIPASIKSIGLYAFWQCPNLANISLPDTPILFGPSVFYATPYDDPSMMENGALYIGKHLIEVDNEIKEADYVIKDGTLSIGAYALSSCDRIRTITVPDSVGAIGEHAFYQNDGLRSVTIGKGVKEIGDYAFVDCPLLENITVDAENQYYMTDEYNVLYDKAQTTLIKLSSRKQQESIVIPGTVTKFCDYAFIGDYYDDEFYYIKDIYFQGTIEQWETIESGEGNEIIITVPIHLTTNGSDYSYSVISEEDKTIMITKYNVIGAIRTVTIPSIIDGYTVTAIGDEAFAVNSLTEVTIPDTVTSIGYRAFYFNNFRALTLPDSLVTIGEEAFMNTPIVDLYMGNNVKTIDNAAFKKTLLSTVYYAGTKEEWNAITMLGDNTNFKNIMIYYQYSSEVEDEEVYTGVCGENLTWTLGKSSGKLVISGTGPMYDYEYNNSSVNSPWFAYKDLIKEIIIEDGVTTIGENAFWSCKKLASISIPDTVTSIGVAALSDCPCLKSLEIPDSVITIGDGAFAYSGLNSVKLSDNLTAISENLFYECVYLEYIDIPDSVTKIGCYAFVGCSRLKNIVVPYSVTTIDYAAFAECTSLYKAVILAPITILERGMFDECENLDEVVLPGTLKSAGYNAFGYCESLRDIYFGGTEEEFKNIVFYELWLPGLTNVKVHYNYTYSEYPFTGFKDNHFYKDDVMQKAYQLVTFGGDFYFIGDRHEIVKNKQVYLNEARINGLTYADGTPIAVGYYEFDENGKMIMREGIVGNNIYENNTQLKAYQLVEVDGDFYYIGDRHEIVKNKKVYLTEAKINGVTYADGTPISVGYYEFDENGKMIILNGIVGNKIYKNNTMLKAYQLVEIDGDFYFIGDRHEIVKDKKVYLNEERINGLTFADGTPITTGYYNVDADGKLIIE